MTASVLELTRVSRVAYALHVGLLSKYDPHQLRDPHSGEWSDGTPSVDPLDKLKLGKLAPPEFTVRSSKKISTDAADIGIAEVDGPDGRQVRVGIITAESGKWDAGFSSEERKAGLWQSVARKQALFDAGDAGADEDEIYELKRELEDLDSERTATLTPEAIADLRRELGSMLALAKENKAKQNATLKQFDALEKQIDDVVDEHSDPDLELQIREAQGLLGALKYRVRLVRDDPRYAHYLPEAEADVAEAERQLEPLLAQRAELMPPEARMQLESLERQKAALYEDDIDGVIASAEVPALNGWRVRAEIRGSDDEDSDWVTSRLYALRPDETTHEAAARDEDYAYLKGLRGLNKLIAGFGLTDGAIKAEMPARPVAVLERTRLCRAALLRNTALLNGTPVGSVDADDTVTNHADGDVTSLIEAALAVGPIALSRMPAQLKKYWLTHEAWGAPGAFDKCTKDLRSHGVPGHMVDGACANLHKEATGEWPGHHNKFDPSQLRDDHGRWSKTGAIRKALLAIAGDGYDEGGTIGFPGPDGEEDGRYLDFSIRDDEDGTVSFELGDIDTREAISVEMEEADLRRVVDAMALEVLRRDPPPFDPSNRQSLLLHSVLQGAPQAVQFGDGNYLDWSSYQPRTGEINVALGDGTDEASFVVTPEEFARMHAGLAAHLLGPQPDDAPQNAVSLPGAGFFGLVAASRQRLNAKFDPSQPRDDDGRWVGRFLKADKLKLDGLGPFVMDNAKIRASDKHRSDNASALFAMTDVKGVPELRFGIVRHEDERKWSGGNHGGTVKLNSAGIADLTSGLEELARRQDHWTETKQDLVDEIEDFDGFVDGADLDEYEQGQVDRYWELADGGQLESGILASGEWGDIRFLVRGTDGEDSPVQTFIAVRPANAPADWSLEEERYEAMEFNSGADVAGFLRRIKSVSEAEARPEGGPSDAP